MRALRARIGTAMVLAPSVAVVVYDEHGHVLLGHHADRDRWVLPGGAVDPGERPADAAVRELWEETGLEIVLDNLIGAFGGPGFEVRYANGDCVEYVMTVFDGRPVGGRLRPDGEEILAVRFFPLDDLPRHRMLPWLVDFLGSLRDGAGRASFDPPVWQPPQDR